MEEHKLCCNCKYITTSYSEEPCKSCKCKSNWADTKPEEFKTGDLVTVGYSKDVYVYLYDNIVMRVPDDVTIDPPDFTIVSPTKAKYSVSAGIDILKTNTNDFLGFTWAAAMDRVQYATVKELGDHNATARKDHPICLGDWIRKRKVNNMEEKKLCTNCKYFSTEYDKEPCKSCKQKSNWVDESKPDKFKNGDIVVMKNDNRTIKNICIYLRDNWVLRVPNYVAVRSECDYVFSTYTDELIADDIAIAVGVYNLEYASPEDITAHDRRAKIYYIVETLNQWFSNLIGGTPEKKHHERTKITVHHMAGVRYDKFPTLNGNFIKRVIFSDPATIVFWEDGTKTVVKTQDGEEYDKEKGLAMAVCKKVFGNERDYYHIFKRWMRKGEERHEET